MQRTLLPSARSTSGANNPVLIVPKLIFTEVVTEVVEVQNTPPLPTETMLAPLADNLPPAAGNLSGEEKAPVVVFDPQLETSELNSVCVGKR